ncbi:GlcG/HbpS family heme-binding protein [Stenotrophomonas maltophilia]|uniref:GlcG/HbpS family heme-binding protein n=1 Tax=Stenotrophomonas maltophilia TaxID=40324 RepID=UPI0012B089D6|nr:heme-binding protein [Stenotrophomonas maltophilia]QGM05619.1 heme-binding protein [Stenotrophomonas maltophilia]
MITTHQARQLIAAAERHAFQLGVPVNIAVLDAGAHLKDFTRQDGAVLGSIDIAISKARTSVLFQIPSESVWDYAKPGAPAPGLENSNGGLAVFPGGLPLFDADGALLGAVGVSGGAPSQDHEIAQAGLAALPF